MPLITSTESAATDAWNDELTATGGSQGSVVMRLRCDGIFRGREIMTVSLHVY